VWPGGPDDLYEVMTMFAGALGARWVLTGWRRWALAALLLGGVATAAGVTVAGANQSIGGPLPNWWAPPRSVQSMLAQISPASIKADDTALVGFGTRNSMSSQTDPGRGVGAAANWITSQLEAIAATSNGAMTVQRQTFVQPPSRNIPVPTTMTNVVATLKGTDAASTAVYVVSGHYDDRVTDVMDSTSDAPGADNDGSGVAAMLELARVMATRPAKASIEFAAFDGEAQGLYGASFFAQQAKAAGQNLQGVLDMNTIGDPVGENGAAQGHVVRLFSDGIPTSATSNQVSTLQALGGEDDSVSRQLARYVKETGQNNSTQMNVQLVFRRDPILQPSDQIAFSAQGDPAVRFAEPEENYSHIDQDVRVSAGVQFGDLLQFVNFNYLARVTRVVASTLAALASSPQTPSNAQQHIAPPQGFAGANRVTLSWDANPEPDVTGYEVVWRDTTDPLWTHALDVGNVTTITLPLNPDNFQFGVRAIDAQGHRSPVAYPSPVTS
jgi:hypothetical protein